MTDQTNARVSLIIPAHNESAVIGRCLAQIQQSTHAMDLEIIVVCNGCSDNTAEVARAAAPTAIVLDLEQAGKVHALNAGVEAATGNVYAFLDSDLQIEGRDVLALCRKLLAADMMGACGRMHLSTVGSAWIVRKYYQAWQLGPYFNTGKFGGFFALQKDVVARLFPLPEMTSDDEYIRRIIAPDQILFDPEICFTAQAPTSLRALMAVRRRVLRGNRQLRAHGMASPGMSTSRELLRKASGQPSLWPAIAVFVAVSVWVRLQSTRQKSTAVRWERDETSRQTVSNV